MSLKPEEEYRVPEDTARVARSIYPEGNHYMRLYDTFGTLFSDQDFTALFAKDGQPALSPVRLALVLILQFAEGLSDRQAADAVRTRIDWKYLLCLELTDPGFHYSVLSEFRSRLLAGEAEQLVLEKLLKHFQDHGLLKARGQQRTDSTHVLGVIRAMNRLELVGEAMRGALNALAVAHPDWMRAHTQPHWIDRYHDRLEETRLPSSQAKRQAYTEEVGADGVALMTALWSSTAPSWLQELPAVKILWRIWIQNFTWNGSGHLRWRQNDELPPAALFVNSPYDDEARYSKKRSTSWVGYKVHLTETCDDDAPHLITHVETTVATTADSDMTTPIHEALRGKGLLPGTHFADAGYVDASILVTARDRYEVDLVGPTRGDYRWQARQGEGFAAQNFVIDWQLQQATCPVGHTSISWTPAIDRRKNEVIKIKFSRKDCRPCPSRSKCTRARKAPRRTITIRREKQHKALQAARAREQTEEFAHQYARRAGVEGTVSQGVRAFDLRRSRYVGLAKTHLQHLLIAAAINIVRSIRWLTGEKPASTRTSAFARLHCPAPT